MCGLTVRARSGWNPEDKGVVDGRRRKGKKKGREEERMDLALGEQTRCLPRLIKRG